MFYVKRLPIGTGVKGLEIEHRTFSIQINQRVLMFRMLIGGSYISSIKI